MSNKIIGIIVIIIIAALGYGIYQFLKPAPTSTPTVSNKMTLSYLVKGCAETDRGMATKSGEGVEREPKIEISGNQIKYSRAINHVCCRKVEIQNEIIGFTINIFEDWSGMGCRCMCFSEIEVVVSDILSGSYLVNVYEKGIKPGSDESMEQKLIIAQEVDIR